MKCNSEMANFIWILEIIGLVVILAMVIMCYCRYRCSKGCRRERRTSSFSDDSMPETPGNGFPGPPVRGRDLPPSYDSVMVSGNPSPGIDNLQYVLDEGEPPPPYEHLSVTLSDETSSPSILLPTPVPCDPPSEVIVSTTPGDLTSWSRATWF